MSKITKIIDILIKGGFLKKWWGILDLNQGPRHSGLCRLRDSPDYLFTHLKGVGRFFAVIKGPIPLR
jgi:hypothetical protein